MTQEDKIIYGTLLVVAFLVIIIIWWSIKAAKKQEEIGANLTVDEVLKHYSKRLPSKNFLWATWKGRLSVKQMEIFVKDEKGEDVAKITYHTIPQDNIYRTIEVGESKYECINNGLTSIRTSLCDENGKVIMTCEHKTLSQIYYESDSDKIKFTLHHTSVLKDFQPIKINDREVGQLISMYEFKCDALLLTLPVNNITLIEKLFILASIPRGN